MEPERACPTVDARDDRPAGEVAAVPVDLDDLVGLLATVLDAEGAPPGAQASLLLVSPERIARLNSEHLGAEGPTDVLSFPIDGTEPDTVTGGGCIVGDVVLCPEVAARQASTHAGDLRSELSLLVVHGALHLCGWDHAEPAQRDRMWERERHLLAAADRSPSADPWGPA